MGKTRDLFKIFRGINGRFHASSVQFSCSVVSDSLWPHGPQHARLPITNSFPSNHLILCHPVLLLSSIFPRIKRFFSIESVLDIRWPKCWNFSISPSNEYIGLISFRIDWFDILVVHAKMGTIKDRNGMDLTEGEDVKKNWQEYTENYTKKIFTTKIITMVWSLT